MKCKPELLSRGIHLNSWQDYACIGLTLVLRRKQCLKLVSLLLYCQFWQSVCVGICRQPITEKKEAAETQGQSQYSSWYVLLGWNASAIIGMKVLYCMSSKCFLGQSSVGKEQSQMLSALTWLSESRLSWEARVSIRDKTRLDKLRFIVTCASEYEVSWPFFPNPWVLVWRIGMLPWVAAG